MSYHLNGLGALGRTTKARKAIRKSGGLFKLAPGQQTRDVQRALTAAGFATPETGVPDAALADKLRGFAQRFGLPASDAKWWPRGVRGWGPNCSSACLRMTVRLSDQLQATSAAQATMPGAPPGSALPGERPLPTGPRAEEPGGAPPAAEEGGGPPWGLIAVGGVVVVGGIIAVVMMRKKKAVTANRRRRRGRRRHGR